ncbi:MAG: hypothetical protein ABIF77_13350 [bacterium]
MALTRLVQTASREFWQESAAGSFVGGTTTTIQTLLERASILFGGTKKILGKITLSTVTGTPVVSAAVSYTGDGLLQVALTNSATGTQAAWTMDLHILDVPAGESTASHFDVVTAPTATPSVGTNRLYVDGTLGSDGNDGSDYDHAWKTLGKLVGELSIQDALFPNASVTYVHARGAFTATDHLILNSLVQGRGRVVIGCDFANSTVTQSGLVVDVKDAIAPAAAPIHDLTCIEVSGITFTATDEGRHLRFNNGATGNIATAQIVSVASGTEAWVSWRFGASGANAEKAAWVVAGSTIAVDVFESAAIIAGYIQVTSSGRIAQGATAPLAGNALSLFNLRTYNPVSLNRGANTCLWLDTRNAGGTAQNIVAIGSTTCGFGSWTDDNLDPADLFEYGFADATSPCYAFGCRAASMFATDGTYSIHGRFTTDVTMTSNSVAYASNARSFRGTGNGTSQVYNSIGSAATTTTSPPFYATAGGRLHTEFCTTLGTAAAGLATGF